MSRSSARGKVFLRVLGWLGIVVPVLIAVTQQGAFAEYSLQKGGSPYYYSGYPGPPAWFWILVFPGFIAGLVFLPFSTWLNNSYKEANAKLRNRQG